MKTVHNIKCLILRCFAVLAAESVVAATVEVVLNSSPAGLVSVAKTVELGSPLTTTNAPERVLGYHFAVWRVNGVDARDLCGRALNPVSLTVYEPITATAYYVAEGEDANTNAIPDWWELAYYPDLIAEPLADEDGDGFSVVEEYRRESHPRVADTLVSGGIAMSCSSPAIVIASTNLFRVSTDSLPFGLYPRATLVTNRGAVLTFPDLYGVSNGYRFVCWEVNGGRQADLLGQSVGWLSLSVQSNLTVCARYMQQDEDEDADGIPDWYEWHCYGSVSAEPSADSDDDGFTLLEEFRRDSDPCVKDDIRSGGASVSVGSPVAAILSANFVRLSMGSNPLGFVPSSTCVTNKGAVIDLPDRFGETNGLRFVYWTANGEIQQDAWGRSLGGFSHVLMSNTVMEAVYVLQDADTNTNAIPDWYEYHFSGELLAAAAQDDDGDGFSGLEEYRRDCHAGLGDVLVPGGVSVSVGQDMTVNMDNQFVKYSVSSSPMGLVPSVSAVTNRGATVVISDTVQSTNGYRFAYWEVDGVVQTDLTGRAAGGFAYCLQSNSVIRANFVQETVDSNANGIADWYEYHFCGRLTESSLDDDSDGWSLLEEFRRDSHPRLGDTVWNGGIAIVVAPNCIVESSAFSRILQCLADGVSQPFFAAAPPGTGTLSVAANSCPALGDWDGDGDLDLFVGGAGGTLRLLENAGSPTVMNWKERTSLFASWQPLWAVISNTAPALGDWSGDGAADLAVGGSTNAVLLFASTGTLATPPASAVSISLSLGGGNLALPAFCDLTDDGRPDLLVLREDGRVSLFTNRCDALEPFASTPVTTDLLGLAVPEACGLTSADADGDGDVDVLVSDLHGRIWEFVQGGAGTFTLKSRIYAGAFDGFANRLTLAAGDVDGDGDPDLICGYAEGGLLFLRNNMNKLALTPNACTLLSGDSRSFAAPNAVGIVSWSIKRNRSGGAIDASTGHYTAGAMSGGLDLVEAADAATGLRGYAYVNVIGQEDLTRVGKAIVIAGRKSVSDPLWSATDYLADMSYNTLLYRGYAKNNIHYLSPEPGQDADGNGAVDDIAGYSSLANVASAVTNWSARSDRLFIYLVDHGGDVGGAGQFRLNPAETLTAAQLDVWLDALQDRYTNDVVVVLDCCEAGSFLDELTYSGPAKRTVLTACSAGEPTYFVAGGLVSFSDAFFAGILLGLDVGQAFAYAREAMGAYQSAQLDANGTGTYQAGVDEAAAANLLLGSSFVAGKDIPQIGAVCGAQALAGTTKAVLWAAQVESAYSVDRVWCLVVPPGHQPDPANPVGDLPVLQLTYNFSTRRYEAEYAGFSQSGTYKVLCYARDVWGSVSLPRQTYVTQSGYLERVILVAGGTTNDAAWGGVNRMAQKAYHTFLSRKLDSSAITYLSPLAWQDVDNDGTNDVDSILSAGTLTHAVSTWAQGAHKLTLYLLGGCGSGGALLLNETNTLAVSDLQGLLNGVQASSDTEVLLVIDYPESGGALPELVAPPGKKRVIVAATKAGQKSLFANDGQVSFSSYFLSDVFNGFDVGAAFDKARSALRQASGRLKQTPLLEDNGDGLANKFDGAIAASTYIGSAFLTGLESPTIEAVTPAGVVSGAGGLTLWASGVNDVNGIARVWCVVTPPSFDGTGNLPVADLQWSDAGQRYEVQWGGFTNGGTYALTFHAQDPSGEVSSPVQSDVLVADPFECDDALVQAAFFDIGHVQAHNVHASNDVDWVRFYCVTGTVYEIEAVQVGDNVDLALDLYRVEADGSLTAIETGIDVNWDGAGEGEYATLNFLADPSLREGFYALRVRTASASLWGVYSDYDVRVWSPTGGGRLIVVAVDKLNAGYPPPGAWAEVVGVGTQAFGLATSVSFPDVPEGARTIRVHAPDGYRAEEDPTLAGQSENGASVLYGNPKLKEIRSDVWELALFQFVPISTVSGRVVDRFTGEPVAGAGLAFKALSGPLEGLTYSGYPNSATYRSDWVTGADGAFPTNVWLPTAQWSLTLSCAGYTNWVREPAVAQMTAGVATNVGTLLLAPLDLNANGVADGWEAQFGLTNMTAESDADGDAFPDRSEYLAGTDPTNRLSVLQILAVDGSLASGFGVKWSTGEARNFRVYWSDTPGAWSLERSVMAGATNVWRDPVDPSSSNRFYRVGVELPQ